MFTKRYFKTKDEVEITFQWPKEDQEITSIAICGDFNEWQSTPMKLNRQKVYTAKLRLPKESNFEFRYLINDEQWENDPAADAYIGNSFGTDNSVISTHG
ncbi:isoamylase early set domain-containing protein [uncultured Vibrio sp.]|uniref:isoamylase early set domain-containing protein n=1 Tax=uncultured Vibrio sp. TaxID=114054 RepID=UPI000910767C|nr:isoamylase early set domain-containing protein [uncultured Vibrio sp.]OIQ26541.1 MAG: 1,4-alpha-glucan branching protein [Vibrio sp. MedPE-SWchi]